MITKHKSLITSSIIVIIFIGVLVWLLNNPVIMTRHINPNTPPPGVETQSLTLGLLCDDDKSIQATIHIPEDEAVDLVLSDGRTMTLPHAVSADGARYANADESIVFWTRGETGFITEGGDGETTYSNCVVDTVTPDWMQG